MAGRAGRRAAGRRRTPGGAAHAIRRIGEPVVADVVVDRAARPIGVDGEAVDAIRDSWVVEDRWWTVAPVRRRYWEVVTAGGAVLVVFREPGGRWFRHR